MEDRRVCIIVGMIDRKNVLVLLGAAVCAIVLSGCVRKSGPRDILLVTVDGELAASARSLGADALVFEHAYSPAPFTLPAAASVLTGLLPPSHGLRIDGVGALSPDTPTLATALAKRGFDCGAFLSSAALDRRHGLTNGFSTYVLVPPSSSGVIDLVAAHLKQADRKRPQFVWVHLSPAVGGVSTNEAAVAEAAIEAGRIYEGVLATFGADAVRAIVPLFGVDSEAVFPGLSLDDASMRVRMAVSGLETDFKPDGADTAPRSIVDIKAMLLTGQVASPATVYSESVLPWYAFGLSPLQVVRGDGVPVPPIGLGAVKSDVLATQAQMSVLRRSGHLGEGLIPAYTNAIGVTALDAAGTALVSRAASARALSGEEGVAAVRALTDDFPKIALFHEWLGHAYYQLRDYTEACNAYAKASDLGVNRVWAYRQQSKCHLLIGNVPLAIDKAEHAFLLNPEDSALRVGLSRLLLNTGSALLAGGQYASAAECLSRVRWLEPKNTDGIFQLARLQLELGQTNNATVLLKEALVIKPGHVQAKRMLEALR